MSHLNYHVCCPKCCVPLLCGPCFCNERDANGRITSVLEAETNKRIVELEAQNKQLLEALKLALEWIDAVPRGTPLPAMPGFDRDWVDAAIAAVEKQK